VLPETRGRRLAEVQELLAAREGAKGLRARVRLFYLQLVGRGYEQFAEEEPEDAGGRRRADSADSADGGGAAARDCAELQLAPVGTRL
jgi:hypothetical protein